MKQVIVLLLLIGSVTVDVQAEEAERDWYIDWYVAEVDD